MFNINNMGEWHDFYVRLDAALLADVMENVRKVMMEAYDLELYHYLSLRLLAFDCALKKSGVTLELIRDPSMHCWIEQGIRGGYVSVGSKRVSAANNRYMGSEYDRSKPTSFISYVDANNLYGCAMSAKLPCSGFSWVSQQELGAFDKKAIMKLDDNGDEGFFFEVDFLVPLEKHQTWNDYPPAPVKRKIDKEELSTTYQHALIEDLGITGFEKVEKLVGDLHPKKNYILHYRILKEYLRTGLKFTKIHAGRSLILLLSHKADKQQPYKPQ